eukprot:14540444-Ditylum_brightwellii.AAC.1
MACFVYHPKSCLRGRLTLVLVHGKRTSSLLIVQLVTVASRFVFAAIGRRTCLPSCKSSLCFPFQKK